MGLHNLKIVHVIDTDIDNIITAAIKFYSSRYVEI